MKPGPIIAMVLMLAIGLALVLVPQVREGRSLDPGVSAFEIVLGASKVRVEQRRDPEDSSRFQYRVARWGDGPGVWRDESSYQNVVNERAAELRDRPWLLKALNATSWGSLLWVAVGLAGQLAFFGRMTIQWVVSERSRTSVVPPLFWWLSLAGGLMLFVYFVWRLDAVGVLGQSTGIVIYARNLRLITKSRRRAERDAATTTEEAA